MCLPLNIQKGMLSRAPLAEFSAGRWPRQQLIASDCKQDGNGDAAVCDSFFPEQFLEIFNEADQNHHGRPHQAHEKHHFQ